MVESTDARRAAALDRERAAVRNDEVFGMRLLRPQPTDLAKSASTSMLAQDAG